MWSDSPVLVEYLVNEFLLINTLLRVGIVNVFQVYLKPGHFVIFCVVCDWNVDRDRALIKLEKGRNVVLFDFRR